MSARSGPVRSFEDLEVFQKAYRMALEVHRASLNFPRIEQRVLGDQNSPGLEIDLREYCGRFWQAAQFESRVQTGLADCGRIGRRDARLDALLPNDDRLWARISQSVSAFLTRVWRDGALMGQKPEQAFFVKCDRTTMTQDDIDNGRLIMLVGIAPVKPAEFVIIRIGQWAGGSSVQEL